MLVGWVCVVVGCFQFSISPATTVSLRFSGHLTTAGSCQQLSDTHIKCQVPAGAQGQLQLQATVSPSTRQVSITAVSIPRWASFSPTTAMGTATASCAFTPPAGSAGQTFQLVFRASVPGVALHLDLTVTLEVTGGAPAEPPSYGPYSGVTDASGRISILIPWMDPPAYIVGTLMECPERILPLTSFSVTLVPKQKLDLLGVLFGGVADSEAAIYSAQDIGSVIVSASAYGDVTVDELSFTSSMDLWGNTTASVNLGDFCLGTSQDQTLTDVTDSHGGISILIPWMDPPAYIVGTLSECTERILPFTSFTLTLVPQQVMDLWDLPPGDIAPPGLDFAAPGGSIASIQDIGSVIVSSSGYDDLIVNEFTYTSSMDLWGNTTTSVHLGEVGLTSPTSTWCGLIPGTTDTDGGFVVDLPWPGTTVSGTLSICDGDLLADQPFSVSLVPSADALVTAANIGGFTFSAAGYEDLTVTRFSKFSIFGFTTYGLGDICVDPSGDLVFQQAPKCEPDGGAVRVLDVPLNLFVVADDVTNLANHRGNAGKDGTWNLERVPQDAIDLVLKELNETWKQCCIAFTLSECKVVDLHIWELHTCTNAALQTAPMMKPDGDYWFVPGADETQKTAALACAETKLKAKRQAVIAGALNVFVVGEIRGKVKKDRWGEDVASSLAGMAQQSGTVSIVAMCSESPTNAAVRSQMIRALAHELGHNLGLGHYDGADKKNLMHATSQDAALTSWTLTDKQCVTARARVEELLGLK